MRTHKSAVLGIGAAIAIGAAVYMLVRPKPLIVDTSVIRRGPLEATVDADGRTRVRERYVIVAPVAGRVQRIRYVEGAAVRAGEVVARITAPPLDSVTVAQARARIESASAIALEAAAQRRSAEAELVQRRRELSRAQRLAEAGGVAPRDVEEAQLAVTQAEEAVRSAVQHANAADADVRQARTPLLAFAAGSPTVVLVRAPAAGRVLRVPERSERVVSAGTALIEVGNPSSLEIVIDVLSSDGAMIHSGDRVRLSDWTGGVDENEPTSWGRVREVEPSAFTKVSALGVEEQRVNVIVDPDAVPPMVGDGFRVEASIVVWTSSDVVVAPRSALLQANGNQAATAGWSAFVVRNGRAERRIVHIGHAGGLSVEVLDGIEPGDEVVLFPSDRVAPGIRVAHRG